MQVEVGGRDPLLFLAFPILHFSHLPYVEAQEHCAKYTRDMPEYGRIEPRKMLTIIPPSPEERARPRHPVTGAY